MITVHYLSDSRAHRILWLLEELQVDYSVAVYERGSDYLAPPALASIHPLGKSPVIEDDGFVLAESGAIMEYLLAHHGQHANLEPARDSDAYWQYRYWMHACEGSAMPLVTNKLLFDILPQRVPLLIRPAARLISFGVLKKLIDPNFQKHIRFWDDTLARTGWFAGDVFSAADIMMSFVVEASLDRFAMNGELHHVRDYVGRIRARPAYQRAMATGGHYRFGQ